MPWLEQHLVLGTLVIIALCGAFGGYVNSVIANKTLRCFKQETAVAIFLGVLAGVVYWMLDGPLKDIALLPKPSSTQPLVGLSLTYGDIGTAIALGTIGGKWITDRADKVGFKKAATKAAKKQPDASKSAEISNASRGEQALTIVEKMPN